MHAKACTTNASIPRPFGVCSSGFSLLTTPPAGVFSGIRLGDHTPQRGSPSGCSPFTSTLGRALPIMRPHCRHGGSTKDAIESLTPSWPPAPRWARALPSQPCRNPKLPRLSQPVSRGLTCDALQRKMRASVSRWSGVGKGISRRGLRNAERVHLNLEEERFERASAAEPLFTVWNRDVECIL
jgi:hypothetical protein